MLIHGSFELLRHFFSHSPTYRLFILIYTLSIFKVNPIAVNSNYCNVFTENKRVVSLISTEEFGKVCHCKCFPLLFSGKTRYLGNV